MQEVWFFLQLVIQGLAVGSVYALVALGFVLIYKASSVINFAQGELLMVGAYVCLALLTTYPTIASADTWAEKLGYPTGARVVIFSAHEMGLSWEMNDAGTDLMQHQRIQSLSVISTGPWFEDFAAW